ncbi:hypothetical protein HY493_05025 [Candidatus Woesearchaeota archaeon]|nr:hypothetical protein [Candidatus Woesearchaeota archaeon]
MLCFSLIILLSLSVSAFGIRPAQKTIEFVPGAEYDGRFTIVRDSGEPANVRVYAEGALAPYITFDQDTLTLEGLEADIHYHVKLPSDIAPGDSLGRIMVEQQLPSGEDGIGARIRITFKIHVTAPYPEKFIGGALDVTSAGYDLAVKTTIQNLGITSLAEVHPLVTITDADDAQVTQVSLPKKPLPIATTETFERTVTLPGIKNGVYRATAAVTYDGALLELIKEFTIGNPTVTIAYKDQYLKAGEINTFNFEVVNQWNAPIDNIVARLSIQGNEQELAAFKTERFSLAAHERKRVTAYLDARKLAPGQYPAMLSIIHDAGSIDEPFLIELLEIDEYEQKVTEAPAKLPWAPLAGLIALLIFNTVIIGMIILKLVKRGKEVDASDAVAAFATKARKLGFDDAEIRQRLQKAGWSSQVIERGMQKTGK